MAERAASPAIAFAAATLGIAIFSAMDAVMKGLSIEMGAYNAMLWRSIFGIAIGGVAFAALRKSWPAREVLKLHVARGLCGGVSVLLFFWGLVHVPIAQGIALSFVAPMIALYLASVILKEKVGSAAILASLLASAGVLVILAGQAQAEMGPMAFCGALAILAAAVLYAFNIILMRLQSQVSDPVETAFFLNIVAGGLFLLFAPWWAVSPSAAQVPGLVFSACCAFVSLMLLSWAYARAEAQYLLPVEYTALLWGALLGWWVFGETVSPLTLIGAAMIIAACLWAARRKPVPLAALEGAA